jgi:arabinose-5-phosphate isomerase
MGLAPTTSTTMMLALGDALSVALLTRKAFSADDFHQLHPGGSLGAQLRRVRDIMHKGTEMPLVQPETPMSEALVEISAKSFGCVGVVGPSGALVGIITDGDLRRHMSPDLLRMTAGEVMTASPKSIRPNALAAEAVAVMSRSTITSLFAIEDGRPVGIVHLHDCLRAGVA